MKAKSGFVLRNIVGEYMLMPTGENIVTFGGTVILNEVSAFIWEKLQAPVTRDEILAALLNEFDVTESIAGNGLDKTLALLKENDLLED